MPDAQFHTTQWSMVIAAGANETDLQRSEALAKLCQTYWFPVYAFIRRQGQTPHDAEDLTQGFFQHLLTKNFVERAREEQGHFRGFLLGALRFYLANERERAGRERRGGKLTAVTIDSAQAEGWMAGLTSPNPDPASSYERGWAISVLERAMARLAEEQKAGREKLFARLKNYIREPPSEGEYETISHELGIPKGTVTVTVYRLTQRFLTLVKTEVADTVARADMVESEMAHLIQLLRA